MLLSLHKGRIPLPVGDEFRFFPESPWGDLVLDCEPTGRSVFRYPIFLPFACQGENPKSKVRGFGAAGGPSGVSVFRRQGNAEMADNASLPRFFGSCRLPGWGTGCDEA